MKNLLLLCKSKYLTGIILFMLPFTVSAQCSGSWTSSNTMNYLCANGPFLQYYLGANNCPSVAQSTFTFSSSVQSVKLIFSAFGTGGLPGQSRMSVFLNNNQIDLNLACRIRLGCQTPSGVYSIHSGCLVDSTSGADGGISGFIYLEATSFGLSSISSIGVAVSEPSSSGTIFELDSCNFSQCLESRIIELLSYKVNIYPNPFTSQTTITFSEEQKNTTIYIRDVLGQIVNSEQVSGSSATIDMSGRSKGVYFVQIMDANKNIVNRKIMLE